MIRRVIFFLSLLTLAACGDGWEYAQTPIPEHSDKPLVVVVGDSIAAGWQVCSPIPCQGIELDWWQSALHDVARVLNRGVGNSTTQDVLDRWARDTQNADIIIILVGVNDAFRGLPARDIVANLTTMHQRALDAGVLPIVATLLPFDAAENPAAYKVVGEVNAALRDHSDWLILDLNGAFPDPPPAGEMATLLHPNALGYARLADYVGEWWEVNQAVLRN